MYFWYTLYDYSYRLYINPNSRNVFMNKLSTLSYEYWSICFLRFITPFGSILKGNTLSSVRITIFTSEYSINNFLRYITIIFVGTSPTNSRISTRRYIHTSPADINAKVNVINTTAILTYLFDLLFRVAIDYTIVYPIF